MRSKATSVILTALIFATVTLTASAQIPLNMSYQARLADSTANPVPDSSYDMEFRFYADSTGGVPVWTESFFDVFTNNGFFDVFLEMDLANLGGPLFMEVMVEGELLYPRRRMTSVPFSAISQRVRGDIITDEGYMVLTNADGDSSFNILSDAGADIISVKMAHPPEQPAFELSSDGINNQISMKMAHPPEGPGVNILADGMANSVNFRLVHSPEMPSIEMSADATQSSFKMIDPSDEKVGFDVFTGALGNSIKLMDPGDESVAAIAMFVDPAQSSFKMIDPGDEVVGFDVFVGGEGNSIKLMDPSDEMVPLLEINGGIGGDINFRMFNPQPEPPAVLMEMNSSPLTGAGFKMFNPQPEPPEPLLEMNTDQYGATFAMTSPQAAGPGEEITDPLLEITVDSSGGTISLYDEIGKYMGLEPMPFTPGGGFYLNDPSTEITNVWIGSDGRLTARMGNFGHDIVNNGNYNLAVGRNHNITGSWGFAGGSHTQVDHDYCFVWSEYPLGPSVTPLQTSADNQFLVRASGGIAFYTNAAMTYGVSLGPGDYAWNSIVPALTARNSHNVDGADILDKIEQLPLKRFSADGKTDHIGPSPGDFNRLFDLGTAENQISMQDQSGIALAGIKELIKENKQLKSVISELKGEIEYLKTRVE